MSPTRTAVILVVLLVGALFTYGGPRLDLPKPRVLPIEEFPRQVGSWRVVAERRPSEDVQKALPTAIILDRDYRDESGRGVSLLLLTARDMKDIHSPAVCLPGSGWQTKTDELLDLHGQKVTARVMTMQGRAYHVWFWYPPVPYPEPRNSFVRRLYRWRLTAPGTYRPDAMADLSSSLLVRVVAPHSPGAREDVAAFVAAIQQPLRELVAAGTRRN